MKLLGRFMRKIRGKKKTIRYQNTSLFYYLRNIRLKTVTVRYAWPTHNCLFQVACGFREREHQMKKKQMTREYIEDFKQMRNMWKQKEADRMEEENQRIQEFAKVQSKREQARQEAKKAMDEQKAKVQDEVKYQIYTMKFLWIY